ncbi:hypothetical protein ACFQPA_11885 [Halomarina halobia]|uniref:Uncharacterized protein n=1 Tax=Halomarina halobia TaxID=3033386 RepID=A0ABD6A9Z7_9EURY|nr:hypothetical protein [Halomarina sp. PSR21]
MSRPRFRIERSVELVGGPDGNGAGQYVDYDGWLLDANGRDGSGSTVDRRGEEAVTIEVGAGEDGLAFDPVAVHVDPGTRIVWEWAETEIV